MSAPTSATPRAPNFRVYVSTLKLSLACLFIALDLLAPLAHGQGQSQDILAERDRYMENFHAQWNELDVRLAKLKIRYDKLESS